MEQIAQNLTELIGNTPLLELASFARSHAAGAHLIAKLEYFNPAGSVKDRIAYAMVVDAEARGVLAPGGVIIEPTSGNTGVGLALVAASKGYTLILTMPETMSIERRMLVKALGAQVVLTPGGEGMQGAINKAIELNQEIQGSVILNQFDNPANPRTHYHTTAEEIWRDTDGRVDVVVGGIGTGGTMSGIGQRLKELNPAVQIVAVEPADSPVLSENRAGAHKIQGIGAGFVPKTYHPEVIDRVIAVGNDPAILTARQVAQTEGLLVGISSGAALWAALQLAREPQHAGQRIVVVLPDTGERYLSTILYAFEDYPL